MSRKPTVPDDLTPQEKRALMAWVKEHAPEFYRADALRQVVGETLDHHRARNNASGYHDWVSVVRNRIRSLHGRGLDEYARPLRRPELPQEVRGSGEGVWIGPQVDNVVRMSHWKVRK